MDNNYHDLYRSAIAVAKELGRDLHEVPLPFQLNELETYYYQISEELKAKQEAALEKKRAEKK